MLQVPPFWQRLPSQALKGTVQFTPVKAVGKVNGEEHEQIHTNHMINHINSHGPDHMIPHDTTWDHMIPHERSHGTIEVTCRGGGTRLNFAN